MIQNRTPRTRSEIVRAQDRRFPRRDRCRPAHRRPGRDTADRVLLGLTGFLVACGAALAALAAAWGGWGLCWPYAAVAGAALAVLASLLPCLFITTATRARRRP